MRQTPKRRTFWFHRGLNYEIRIILAGEEYPSLMSMVNRAMAVEKEVTLGAERLRTKRRRACHQSHLNMLGQNSQVHQEDDYQDDQNRQHIGQTLEQYTEMTPTLKNSALEEIMMKCRSCRQRAHKRAECPGRKALGKKKPAKKLRKKDKQHGKRRKPLHQDLGGTPPGVKDASPLPHQNNLQSNSSKLSKNLERDHYNSQQPRLDNTTESATISYFACNKVGHKASYCPEKKKNRMPGPASGSASKSAQASRTIDRCRLTHLTGRETRDAPYAMIGEFSSKTSSFNIAIVRLQSFCSLKLWKPLISRTRFFCGESL